MTDTRRPYGVLSDEELRQRLIGIVDPLGEQPDAEQRATAIIAMVRANTTCIGDMNRGCY